MKETDAYGAMLTRASMPDSGSIMPKRSWINDKVLPGFRHDLLKVCSYVAKISLT